MPKWVSFANRKWTGFWMLWSILFMVVDFADGNIGWGIFMLACALGWGWAFVMRPS